MKGGNCLIYFLIESAEIRITPLSPALNLESACVHSIGEDTIGGIWNSIGLPLLSLLESAKTLSPTFKVIFIVRISPGFALVPFTSFTIAYSTAPILLNLALLHATNWNIAVPKTASFNTCFVMFCFLRLLRYCLF